MTRQREDNLSEIKDWLSRLSIDIEGNGILRHQNSYIELENFFCALLNQLFGWKLANANQFLGPSQDSFDLSDAANGIAVQVTVTTGAKKITKTLRTFISSHRNAYSRLLFAYPIFKLNSIKKDFSSILQGYKFDVLNDRIGFGTVLAEAQMRDIASQRNLIDLLSKELAPIGGALRIGRDDTLVSMISVISYMSEHSPVDRIDYNEQQPALARKLERFKEHASYLKIQYQDNQRFHTTMSHARQAVGCDAVRTMKIQSWLKTRSIEALEQHDNNAMRAFSSLVRELVSAAHSAGTDAEESAVRFLLADELTRCNVFPNPD